MGRAVDSGAEPPCLEGARELALVIVWEQVYSNLVVCMDGWFTFFTQLPLTLFQPSRWLSVASSPLAP